jgi:hypothetical protein
MLADALVRVGDDWRAAVADKSAKQEVHRHVSTLPPEHAASLPA